MIDELILKMMSYLRPNDSVLDLGAGMGVQAEKFIHLGMKVEAVDKIKPNDFNSGIIWYQEKIEDFLIKLDNKFNLIFCRNLIQFLDSNWVFNELIPRIKSAVEDNGLIYLRTFYKNPMPNFKDGVLSLYKLSELTKQFENFDVIFSKEYKKYGKDLKGSFRKFFLVDLLVKKNN